MTLILSGTNGVSDIDGDASTPAIRGTDANTGIFFGADQVGVATNGVERVEFGNSETVFNDGGADVDFRVEGDSEANLIFVDASTDRIGVGTSTPGFRTVIKQNSTGAIAQVLQLENNATIATGKGLKIGFGLGDNEGSTRGYIEAALDASNGTYMAFATNDGSTGTYERARIGSNGFFRIGMGNYANDPSSSNYGWSLEQNGSNPFINHATSGTGTSTMIAFINGNGSRGSIQTNATNTLYNTTSDYRLKENVAPMTGALVKVSQLKPSTYTWKVDGSEGQGFIAHELAEVCPDAVSGEKDAVDEKGDPKYQMIDTSFLVATLTAAIQELKAINDAQASRIETLEAKVAALEAK